MRIVLLVVVGWLVSSGSNADARKVVLRGHDKGHFKSRDWDTDKRR